MNVPHARGLDAWPRRRFSFSRLGNNLHSDCRAKLSVLQKSGYLGVTLQTFFFCPLISKFHLGKVTLMLIPALRCPT